MKGYHAVKSQDLGTYSISLREARLYCCRFTLLGTETLNFSSISQ